MTDIRSPTGPAPTMPWSKMPSAAAPSRRELLQMLLAGGVALAAGGSILGRASAALAATPVMGGHLKAAGWSPPRPPTRSTRPRRR